MSTPNFDVLQPSRKKLAPGDVFVMRYRELGYIFGRVIDVDMSGHPHSPLPGCNLIYIYDVRSPRAELDGIELRRDRLLVAPLFVNRLPWSRGYFQTIARGDLAASDILDRHCYDASFQHRMLFVGDNYTELDEVFEPCGVWGVHSYLTVDYEVSAALGLPPPTDW